MTTTSPDTGPAGGGDLIFCAECDASHGRYECPGNPFGPAETITVADLAAGDFVVSIPAQAGTRGARVNSGVADITPPRAGRWYTRSRPRGPRQPVASRRIRFLDSGLASLDVPCTHQVVARRRATPAAPPLDLEAQVARLEDALLTACEDTAGDQGDEIVDTGGWAELAHAVADLAGPEITAAAKAEFFRRNGLAARLAQAMDDLAGGGR